MNETRRDNIMVVDDTPANLKLLVDMLSGAGYESRPLLRGDLAIRAAKSDPPDLILLDINMPGMNGYDVCEKLKEDPKLREVPIIFISALNDTLDKVKAFGAGGVDYITKPFQFEEVRSRIETHLTLCRYQRALQEKNQSLENALDALKQTQMKLVQSEKMASLGVLTAGIAHEINNPVNFIKTGIDGMSSFLPDLLRVIHACEGITPETAEHDLEEIEQLKRDVQFDDLLEGVSQLTSNIKTGVERTVEIVSGLRIFSRLDEGEEKKLADLQENIEATLVILRHRFKGRITIQKDYGTLPAIWCYPAKLNQAFMNLLVNAIDAIECKAETVGEECINISTSLVEREGQRCACVTVSDSGIGIASEIQERIFEPFYTTKDVGVGNGLGLAITKGVIDSHGGILEFETSPETGTLFRIYLPYNGVDDERK